MKKKKIIISSLIMLIALLGYGIYHMFFSFVIFTVPGINEISNKDYGIYVDKNVEVVDQMVYQSKIRKRIGITTNGDYVCELKNDPSHQHLILIMNTEMGPWFLYTLKK